MGLTESLIDQTFGKIFDISQGFKPSHDGVDLRAPLGTPIYAVETGKVVYAEDARVDPNAGRNWAIGGGKVVNIDVGGNLRTQYAHLDSINVESGQTVKKGQLIGTVGKTGFTIGNPHLHFGLWDTLSGKMIEPSGFLSGSGSTTPLTKGNQNPDKISPGDIGEGINLNPFDALSDVFGWIGVVLVGLVFIFGGILLLGLGGKKESV
jgi:murein DD-endopeptidase MepM/ murein hydrolase activator NlpD